MGGGGGDMVVVGWWDDEGLNLEGWKGMEKEKESLMWLFWVDGRIGER